MSTLLVSTTFLWFALTFADNPSDPQPNTNNSTMIPTTAFPLISTTNQIYDTTQVTAPSASSSNIGAVLGALFISAISVAITILIIKFCVCTDKWRQCLSNKQDISGPYNTNKHGPDTTTNHGNTTNSNNFPTEKANQHHTNDNDEYYTNDRRVYGSAADLADDIDEEVFRELDKIDSSYPGYTPRTTRGSSVGYIESILEKVTSVPNEEVTYPKKEEWEEEKERMEELPDVGSVPEMGKIPKPLRISINDDHPIVVEVITPIETPVLLEDEIDGVDKFTNFKYED